MTMRQPRPTSESGGSSKGLIIGGGIAAVAAIAAVVVFVVKPFGGSAAGPTPPAGGRGRATGTLSIDSSPRARVFIDETPKGTTPLRLDLAGRASTASASKRTAA